MKCAKNCVSNSVTFTFYYFILVLMSEKSIKI